MKRNWIILLAVLATIVIVVITNRTGESSPAASPDSAVSALPDAAPKKGSPAPSFRLESLDGTANYQVGGARDKLLLVNFWASWCWPCQQEAPDLVKIFDQYKDSLDLYAVNATKYDKARNAKVFVEEQGFHFPVLTDAKGTVGDTYVVNNFPTSFLIDRHGTIVARIDGMATLDQLEKLIRPLLGSTL